MIREKKFSEKKWIRFAAYGIVLGFAFLMFLPASISLRDIFEGRGIGSDLIGVNGKEIFYKNLALYEESPKVTKSIYDVAQDYFSGLEKKSEKRGQLFWFSNMLSNLDQKSPIGEIEGIRTLIKLVISWEMGLDLAEGLGVRISKESLGRIIRAQYVKYLRSEYQEILGGMGDGIVGVGVEEGVEEGMEEGMEEERGELSWEDFLEENEESKRVGYYEWGVLNLGDQYLWRHVGNLMREGSLMNEVDVAEELKLRNRRVKVSYAMYRYEDFLEEDFLGGGDLEGVIKEEDIEEYYRANEEKVLVERYDFDSKEEGEEWLGDMRGEGSGKLESKELESKELESKELESKKPELRKPEKKGLRLPITVEDDEVLFNELKSYKEGEMTGVIEKGTEGTEGEDGGSKKYYVYEVIETNKDFKDFKEDKKKYRGLVKEYMNQNSKKYQKWYEEVGKEKMGGFLEEAKILEVGGRGWGFEDVKRKDKREGKYRNVRTGETGFFSQDPEKVKRVVEGEEGEDIKEFLLVSHLGKKEYNEEFFKESFRLEEGELSDGVRWGVWGMEEESKIYFILKKEGEEEKEEEGGEELLREKLRASDYQVLNELWIKYLEKVKGYEVKVNVEKIIERLGLTDLARQD